MNLIEILTEKKNDLLNELERYQNEEEEGIRNDIKKNIKEFENYISLAEIECKKKQDFEEENKISEKEEEPKLTYQTGATKVKIQYNGEETEVNYREHWKVGKNKGTKVFRKILEEEPTKKEKVKVVKITLSKKDFFAIYTA